MLYTYTCREHYFIQTMPDYDFWRKVLFLSFKQIKYMEKGY